MKTEALCHGAATVVNAIACGRGAAFGISLETRAEFELLEPGVFECEIEGAPDEDTSLMELCAKKVFGFFGLDCGARIKTKSSIPIARGLKSSSTAANAVVLAAAAAVVAEHPELPMPSDLALINLGVEAALEAKVTITGAFDDAAASYLGGFVVSDNEKRGLLKSGDMEPLNVLLFVPEQKSYTAKVDVGRLRLLKEPVLVAWNEALRGSLHTALTLNGLLYSAALGFDSDVAFAALEAGALSAGLCGKGPAVAALVGDDVEAVKSAWEAFDGEVVVTCVNNEKAHIL